MSSLMTRTKRGLRNAMAVCIALAGGLLVFSPSALAQSSRALQSIDYVSLDSERLLLTLTLS